MAANDQSATAGNQSQETESPGTLATSSGNAPRPAAISSRQIRDIATSACTFTTLTPDFARPAGSLALPTGDGLWSNTNHAMYTRNVNGANVQMEKLVVEKLSTNKPSTEDEEGTVGGMANDHGREMINIAHDTVDGPVGLQDGYKGVANDAWEQVKDFPSVKSCIFVFDEENVRQAFKMNKLGNITENTSANEIARQILNMTEDDHTIHDLGQPADGSRHVLEAKHACEECLKNGVEPILRLK